MSKETNEKHTQRQSKNNINKNKLKSSKASQAKKTKDDKIKKLQKDLEESQKKVINLNVKIRELETENQKNIEDFHKKANGFVKKAQSEVARLREEINAKQVEDLKHHKKYGSQKLLESILEPLINISLAVKAGKSKESVKAYVIGFEMLLTQLENELATFGVFKIMPKVGDDFNPKTMHAMKKTEAGNKVISLNKPGFLLHDRVIIPAIVTLD